MTSGAVDTSGTGPGPAADLASLSLAQLRHYRQQLLAEEDRVSYWRRLVHARLDLQRAGQGRTGPLDVQQISAALRATGADVARRVFAPTTNQAAPSHLPALARFWTRTDPQEDLDTTLEQVEDELSEYRAAVHAHLDAATAELVRRYQQAPEAALSFLPDAP